MAGWTENQDTKITKVITKQVLESEILKLKEYLENENILSFKLQAKKELLEELQDEVPRTETSIFVINKINEKLENINYKIELNYEMINGFQIEINFIERMLHEKITDVDVLDNYEITKFRVNYEDWMDSEENKKYFTFHNLKNDKRIFAEFKAINFHD